MLCQLQKVQSAERTTQERSHSLENRDLRSFQGPVRREILVNAENRGRFSCKWNPFCLSKEAHGTESTEVLGVWKELHLDRKPMFTSKNEYCFLLEAHHTTKPPCPPMQGCRWDSWGRGVCDKDKKRHRGICGGKSIRFFNPIFWSCVYSLFWVTSKIWSYYDPSIDFLNQDLF